MFIIHVVHIPHGHGSNFCLAGHISHCYGGKERNEMIEMITEFKCNTCLQTIIAMKSHLRMMSAVPTQHTQTHTHIRANEF